MSKGRKALVEKIKESEFIILCANCHIELHAGLWEPEANYIGDNHVFNGISPLSAPNEKIIKMLLSECHPVTSVKPLSKSTLTAINNLINCH